MYIHTDTDDILVETVERVVETNQEFAYNKTTVVEDFVYHDDTWTVELINPKTEFGLGDKIGIVVEVNNAIISHQLEADIYAPDGKYLYATKTEWHEVEGIYEYSYLMFKVDAQKVGTYKIEIFWKDNLERIHLETVTANVSSSDTNPLYIFHGIQAVESFEYNPSTWLYDVINPKTDFDISEGRIGVVARVDNVYINHQIEVEITVNSVTKTVAGDWRDVGDSYFDHSNLAFYQEISGVGDYLFEVYLNDGEDRIYLGQVVAHVSDSGGDDELQPVNGKCGSAELHLFEKGEQPDNQKMCEIGIPDGLNEVCNSGDCFWDWDCLGENGGEHDDCFAEIDDSNDDPNGLNGSCGPADGKIFTEDESFNKNEACNMGSLFNLQIICDDKENCRYEWNCLGENGGSNAICDAEIEKAPPVKLDSYNLYVSFKKSENVEKVCKKFILKRWVIKANGKSGKEKVVKLKLCATENGETQLLKSNLEPDDYFLKVVGGSKKVTHNGKLSKTHKVDHLILGDQYEQDVTLYFE